jgi:4,5-dihydroxyphthalate decarboxylase
VASYVPPTNVEPANGDLGELLINGEIDAVIGLDVDHPDIASLIPEPEEAAIRALRQRAFYPINHLVVVKDSVLQRYPEAARAVFDAFTQAKQRYVSQLRDGAATDAVYSRVLQTTGTDPLPYGVEPNRAMLQQLVQFALDQRILTRPVGIDEMFAEIDVTAQKVE